MEYPERRTITWLDEETGNLVGKCEYIRADLCASGQQVRAAAHRILELYDDAMRDMLDPGAHDTHPDSDELAELRRIVGAPAHSWTPAPDAQQPEGEAEPVAVRHSFDGYGWQYADQGNGSDWLARALARPDAQPLYAHSPQPSETVAACETVLICAQEMCKAGVIRSAHLTWRRTPCAP